MSKLISGKEALIALANGEKVECRVYGNNWINADNRQHTLSLFFDDCFQFRLKPRTITINGIEVPAPFDPKDGEEYWCFSTHTVLGYGRNVYESESADRRFINMGAWRTEEEIKQVVETLREVFKIAKD